MLIQDISDLGAGCCCCSSGAARLPSTSFGLEGTVGRSVGLVCGSVVNGANFLTGEERPDEVVSRRREEDSNLAQLVGSYGIRPVFLNLENCTFAKRSFAGGTVLHLK